MEEITFQTEYGDTEVLTVTHSAKVTIETVGHEFYVLGDTVVHDPREHSDGDTSTVEVRRDGSQVARAYVDRAEAERVIERLDETGVDTRTE